MAGARDLPGEPGNVSDWKLLLAKVADLEARLAQMPHAPSSGRISDSKLGIIATAIYRARRRRLNYFERLLFDEPAWDMLLDLFANKALGRRVSVTSLCLAADVPTSTGLRYLRLLEKSGLAERTAAPDDRRVTLVDLTRHGYGQMQRYIVDGMARFDLPNPE